MKFQPGGAVPPNMRTPWGRTFPPAPGPTVLMAPSYDPAREAEEQLQWLLPSGDADGAVYTTVYEAEPVVGPPLYAEIAPDPGHAARSSCSCKDKDDKKKDEKSLIGYGLIAIAIAIFLSSQKGN